MTRRAARKAVTAERIGWNGGTPLWYYILREADVHCGGNRLGPLGTRIVAEVLIGLVDLDPTSVRGAPAGWTPHATLVDLLTHGDVSAV
ncbi:MAG TPA: hypothetical protein VKE51_18130 [Vicinamibacterales bacterium]|nr:hypothetical protein [Vicinamibacterales bacterium]